MRACTLHLHALHCLRHRLPLCSLLYCVCSSAVVLRFALCLFQHLDVNTYLQRVVMAPPMSRSPHPHPTLIPSAAAGPFFSWPAAFLPNDIAAAGFAFINSIGAVGGFIGGRGRLCGAAGGGSVWGIVCRPPACAPLLWTDTFGGCMHPSASCACAHTAPLLHPLPSHTAGPFVLGRLTDRADGGFSAAMAMLAAFLVTAGTLILVFPAPGQRPEPRTIGISSGGGGHGSGARNNPEVASGSDEDGAAEAEGGEWPERRASLRWQRERERLEGGGGGGELEFQPILPARSGHCA